MFYDSALNVPTMGQLAEEKELQNLLQTGGRKGFAAMEFDGSVNMSQYMGLAESANGNTRMVGQRFGPGAMNDPSKINAMQPAGPEATYDSDEGLWVCIGPGESSIKFAHATKAGAEEALAEWTAQGAEKNPMDGDEERWGMAWKDAPEAKTVEASDVMKGIGYSEASVASNVGIGVATLANALAGGLRTGTGAGAAVGGLLGFGFAKGGQMIGEKFGHQDIGTALGTLSPFIATIIGITHVAEQTVIAVYHFLTGKNGKTPTQEQVVTEIEKLKKENKITESRTDRDPYIEELLKEGFMSHKPSLDAFGNGSAGSDHASGLGYGSSSPLSGGVPGSLLPTFAKLIAGGIGLAMITAAYHKIKGVKGSEPTDAELEVEVKKTKSEGI